jgi:hypothetical protein
LLPALPARQNDATARLRAPANKTNRTAIGGPFYTRPAAGIISNMQTANPYDERHSNFERFAEAASNVTSRSAFFGVVVLLACAWVWAIAADEARIERLLVGLFTLITLLKISLLANSEKRQLEELNRQQTKQTEQLELLVASGTDVEAKRRLWESQP